jgi:hypothetical protein
MRSPTTTNPGTWRDQAACHGHDPALWWLETGHYANTAARRICNTCPVREPCLADAINRHDQGVIRGGVKLRAPMQWHTCQHCGQDFLRRRGGRTRAEYCDETCRVAGRRAALAARMGIVA